MKHGLLIFFCFLSGQLFAVTYDQYIGLVKKNSLQLKSNTNKIDSLKQAHQDVAMAFSPNLTAVATKNDDKNQYYNTALYGNQSKTSTLLVGVNKKFFTGTTISLNSYASKIKSFDSTAAPPIEYRNYNEVSIKQDLWKGLMARDLNAKINESRFSNQSSIHELQGSVANIKYQSTVTFWDFALKEKMLELKKKSLERAKAALRWTLDRKKLGISEKSDVFTSKASVAKAQNFVEQSLQQRDESKRMFDQYIGDFKGSSNNVPEVSWEFYKKNIQRTSSSANTLSAKSIVDKAHATSTVRRTNVTPSLNVEYAYRLNGFDTDTGSNAFKESRKNDFDRWQVNVNLVAPLDIFRISKIRNSTKKGIIAADHELHFAKVQEERQWNQIFYEKQSIERQIKFSKQALESFEQAVKAEQTRFRQGRSTLLNLNQAEDNFAGAQELYYTSLFAYQEILARASYYNNQGFN